MPTASYISQQLTKTTSFAAIDKDHFLCSIQSPILEWILCTILQIQKPAPANLGQQERVHPVGKKFMRHNLPAML